MRVGADDGGHSGGGGLFGIFAYPTDVGRLAERTRSHTDQRRLGDQPVNELPGQNLAQPPTRITDQQGGSFPFDLERDPGPDPAVPHRGDVERHTHHAVRVVAPQVRPHQARREDLRLTGRDPRGQEQGLGESRECLSGEKWHGCSGRFVLGRWPPRSRW